VILGSEMSIGEGEWTSAVYRVRIACGMFVPEGEEDEVRWMLLRFSPICSLGTDFVVVAVLNLLLRSVFFCSAVPSDKLSARTCPWSTSYNRHLLQARTTPTRLCLALSLFVCKPCRGISELTGDPSSMYEALSTFATSRKQYDELQL
jgi:hypothetical protein